MSAWIAVLAIGAGSYLFRFVPLVALANRALPPTVDRALRHAGTAALAALIGSSLTQHRSSYGTAAAIAFVAALGVGVALSVRRRPLPLVLLCGLATYAGLQPLFETLAN